MRHERDLHRPHFHSAITTPVGCLAAGPGSVWGLPLPSPCLHSHLPVREPRPPHSSHSGRLLLTAQDRGQPGSSATSGDGRKQVTGGQPGPSVLPAPRGRAALAELPHGLSPEGMEKLSTRCRAVMGLLGKGGGGEGVSPQPKGAQLLGWIVQREDVRWPDVAKDVRLILSFR